MKIFKKKKCLNYNTAVYHIQNVDWFFKSELPLKIWPNQLGSSKTILLSYLENVNKKLKQNHQIVYSLRLTSPLLRGTSW